MSSSLVLGRADVDTAMLYWLVRTIFCAQWWLMRQYAHHPTIDLLLPFSTCLTAFSVANAVARAL